MSVAFSHRSTNSASRSNDESVENLIGQNEFLAFVESSHSIVKKKLQKIFL